jgi:hypothetical protein
VSELINIRIALAFIGGVVAVVAIWTQHDINRAREKKESASNKAPGKNGA